MLARRVSRRRARLHPTYAVDRYARAADAGAQISQRGARARPEGGSLPSNGVAVPHKALVSWAIAASGGKVLRSVTGLAQSGELGPWLLEVDTPGGQRRLVLHAGETGSEEHRRLLSLRAVAQEVAAHYGLPAPEVVATDDGTETDWLAVLETALSGTSRIPMAPEPLRLRVLGQEAARVNAVRPSATAGLPRRRRSLEGVPFEACRCPMPAET